MVDFRFLGGAADQISGGSGVSAFPTGAAPADGVSIAEVLREIYEQGERVATSAVAALVNGTTVFTVAGGSIMLIQLIAVAVTSNGASPASTLQYSCDPTDGAATTFTGATATLASLAAGGYVVVNGTALTTAPDIVANGAALGPVIARSGIIIPAGIITTVVGVGSTTGTFRHCLRYKPLARGVTVT